ncbi:hypothetical protein NEIFLAOT_02490 [Neisseria flavescens NRL30031/H210]|uniref:Uncharacterized protein n=1 Tax=Neisseria flavescens NRL30031/H210 TaxID=546264 RepID=C0ER89_NEIFL|nr:hypothetical protein NEIFLAOT_02490 [Neisseria flavescens NRL30031/H210]
MVKLKHTVFNLYQYLSFYLHVLPVCDLVIPVMTKFDFFKQLMKNTNTVSNLIIGNFINLII